MKIKDIFNNVNIIESVGNLDTEINNISIMFHVKHFLSMFFFCLFHVGTQTQVSFVTEV
mgnify:CR=1 FL=1